MLEIVMDTNDLGSVNKFVLVGRDGNCDRKLSTSADVLVFEEEVAVSVRSSTYANDDVALSVGSSAKLQRLPSVDFPIGVRSDPRPIVIPAKARLLFHEEATKAHLGTDYADVLLIPRYCDAHKQAKKWKYWAFLTKIDYLSLTDGAREARQSLHEFAGQIVRILAALDLIQEWQSHPQIFSDLGTDKRHASRHMIKKCLDRMNSTVGETSQEMHQFIATAVRKLAESEDDKHVAITAADIIHTLERAQSMLKKS